jgi:hypothetical protein
LCAIIPIKSYSNAEAEKNKILKENKNKSNSEISSPLFVTGFTDAEGSFQLIINPRKNSKTG